MFDTVGTQWCAWWYLPKLYMHEYIYVHIYLVRSKIYIDILNIRTMSKIYKILILKV